MHRAIDIGADLGTAVVASRDGIVHRYDWDGHKDGYGNHVLIEHGNDYWTLYAHLDTITIHDGQEIKQGDILGTIGDTGNANGTHLHFEIRHSNLANFLDLPHYIPGDHGDRVCQGFGIPHMYPGIN